MQILKTLQYYYIHLYTHILLDPFGRPQTKLIQSSNSPVTGSPQVALPLHLAAVNAAQYLLWRYGLVRSGQQKALLQQDHREYGRSHFESADRTNSFLMKRHETTNVFLNETKNQKRSKVIVCNCGQEFDQVLHGKHEETEPWLTWVSFDVQ